MGHGFEGNESVNIFLRCHYVDMLWTSIFSLISEGKKASVAFSAEKCYPKSVFSKQVLRYEDTKGSRQETRRDQP